jgi:ComF family protein
MPPPTWLRPVISAGRSFADGLLQLLYPNQCWVCGDAMNEERSGFCARCHQALATDPLPSCPRCAGTVGPFVDVTGGCVNCREEKFAFDRVVRLGPYDGLLRDVILRLKHWNAEGLAERLGQLWTEERNDALRDLKADVIIPMPLHWKRRLTRGYNQSHALARMLSGALRVSFRPRWLRRIRATPAQASQTSPTARRENMRGAFTMSPGSNLQGKTVLLVDDVMTTGSTAHEAARAVLVGKPARIVVAVLARASP